MQMIVIPIKDFLDNPVEVLEGCRVRDQHAPPHQGNDIANGDLELENAGKLVRRR